MRNAIFAVSLLIASSASAATITVHTCTCTTVPQNVTADIVSSDYIEPPDDVQAASWLEDLAWEPPYNPNFAAEQLVLRKIKECSDTTIVVPDMDTPTFTPRTLKPEVEIDTRSVPEPPLVGLLGAALVVWWKRRVVRNPTSR